MVKIKLIILDIDGVMTDGKVVVDHQGSESKRFCFKDFDAFSEIHDRGLKVGAITREISPICNYLQKKVVWDFFYSGIKDKSAHLESICLELGLSKEQICYVGDGKHDLEIMQKVGLPLCPNDAIDQVKKVAKEILSKKGGDGCVWEMISVIDRYNDEEVIGD